LFLKIIGCTLFFKKIDDVIISQFFGDVRKKY